MNKCTLPPVPLLLDEEEEEEEDEDEEEESACCHWKSGVSASPALSKSDE